MSTTIRDPRPRDRAARLRAAIAAVVALGLSGRAASAEDIREDPVGGSCAALVGHVQRQGVTDSTGRHWPNDWGATERSVTTLVNQIALEDVGKTGKLPYEEIDKSKPGLGGTPAAVCLATGDLQLSFRAENRISVIEWKHSYKNDSKCAQEWRRVRGIIRQHELAHVHDYDEVLKDASTQLAPLTACGATRAEASARLADALVAVLKTKAAELKAKLDAKQARRDRETVTMNCSLCDRQVTFDDATIDCTIRTPQCSLHIKTAISGRVCGDPLTTLWKMRPTTTTSGCGAPPSSKSSKWFDNDCVEAGSDTERQRVQAYRMRPSGAGGWMCVYSADPQPTVTIRSFRLSMCDEKAEQTVTVPAATSDTCEEEPAKPPPAPPPSKPRPDS